MKYRSMQVCQSCKYHKNDKNILSCGLCKVDELGGMKGREVRKLIIKYNTMKSYESAPLPAACKMKFEQMILSQ